MDFDDSAEDAAFRAEVRSWLAANAEPIDGAADPFAEVGDEASAAHVARCQTWQAKLFAGGWAGLGWPPEFGGRGLDPNKQAIFAEEQARFDAPTGIFAVGIGMVGPTLIEWGTDTQKARYLEPMLTGREIWCQLFSEPAAGSDLAAVRTRATVDGDHLVLDGQKVWTSSAQHSHLGIALVRTDWDVPKHAGITCCIVDMSAPGVEVRPLHQIDGAAHFNEVFLDGVRVPLTDVIGPMNEGWKVARTTLSAERVLIAGGHRVTFSDLERLVRASGGLADPTVRDELVQAWCRLEIQRFLKLRIQTARSQGRRPGPEASVMKLGLSLHLARTADLMLAAEGAAGMLAGADAPQGGYWQRYFLGQWRSRIGGGTDQIQRNVVGERALGLPPEPRADRDVPFRDLPTGA